MSSTDYGNPFPSDEGVGKFGSDRSRESGTSRVGTVSAGFVSPPVDATVKRIDLNDAFIRHPEATYVMRAAGDAMRCLSSWHRHRRHQTRLLQARARGGTEAPRADRHLVLQQGIAMICQALTAQMKKPAVLGHSDEATVQSKPGGRGNGRNPACQVANMPMFSTTVTQKTEMKLCLLVLCRSICWASAR